MVFLKGTLIKFRKIDGKRGMNGVTRSYGGKVRTKKESSDQRLRKVDFQINLCGKLCIPLENSQKSK